MPDAKMLVFSNATEGQDATFNEWYDTVHLADVLSVPGVVGGQRFELVPNSLPGQEAPEHRYLAVYDLDADPDSVVRAFQERAGSGEIPLSPALDVRSLAVSVWRASGERQVPDVE
ncbi:hypothetical protein [Nocardia callitridis]|uniref:DUF4286 family protein n=1 Tax=Nocardia callitridis TaxID=648753 RepID=A0ABP9KWG9_9NOCA